MNKLQIEERLEGMLNKTFSYGGRIHCVLSFSVANNRASIKTNLETYEKTYDAMGDFLSYWEEHTSASAVATVEQVKAVPSMETENNLVTKLTEILMDNIAQVKTNPDYIKQAQAINNNVNSIINVTKLKLDVIKASRGGR